MVLTKRDRYIRKKYGITEATYEAMFKKGGKKCWICQRPPKPGKKLNIDHDHRTGQVRGLLCFFCNKFLIGRRRREHANLFARAAAYLASTVDWRKPNAV